MSTNYYLTPAHPCECCGRPYETMLIGKTAGGWRFILWAKDRGDTFEKVKQRIRSAVSIYDEYRKQLTAEEMINIIQDWQEGKYHLHDDDDFVDSQGYVFNQGDWS